MINTLVSSSAFMEVVNLAALISLSLAFGNLLLPISVLDGGQLALEIFQSARRKPLSERSIGILNLVGIIIVVLLTIVIAAKDIWQYGILSDIAALIRSALGR
jgi:membrane-associated protease RseP (regulator of RpoE activity)